MEYFSDIRINRRLSRALRELSDYFLEEIGLTDRNQFKQFKVLEYDRNTEKILCSRMIEDSLKEDLESGFNQHGMSRNFCGRNWFLSGIDHCKNGKSYLYVFENCENEKDELIKKYIYFQMEAFFSCVCMQKQTVIRDANTFIENLIYENALVFIQEMIGIDFMNYITEYPDGMLANHLVKLSYMQYEGDDIQNKYIAFFEKEQVYDITFQERTASESDEVIRLMDIRKVRKLLEITYRKSKDDGLSLACVGNKVKGYISSDKIKDNFYLVEFNGCGKWSFSHQGKKNSKIVINDRRAHLIAADSIMKEEFISIYDDIFEQEVNSEFVWTIVEEAQKQKHGTMLLFTENALVEKERLKNAGYEVEISDNNDRKYIEAITGIDGAVLLDQNGKVHMIGVILDGEMSPKGTTMARGARYNSAVKYSYSHRNEKHLVVVISEDGDCDFVNYNILDL